MRTEPAITDPLWFVVFCDPEPVAPGAPLRNRLLAWALRALFRPGFRHCYAMRPMHRAEGWLLYNRHSACSDLFELPQEWAVHVFAEAEAGRCTVVRATARRPVGWTPRVLSTCATNVAHLLGIPARPWATPYALYRHLTQEDPAMGGVISPKKPDTSAADAAAKAAQEEAAATKAANEAKLRNIKAGQSGRSLLTFAGTGETGVGKTTLGAG